MNLVINNLVGEKLSLENVIDILDEYSPQDEHISLSLETVNGQTIQASCRKQDWLVTKEKFLLRLISERLSSEISTHNECLIAFFIPIV